MLTVDIERHCDSGSEPGNDELERWARASWQQSESAAEVALVIIDQETMVDFNTRYRNRNKATNVLSFPAGYRNEDGVLNLGDVLLCAPVIGHESREQNKRSCDHWAHMTVHGMLHLQGYDHVEHRDAEVMENLEVNILDQLGVADPYQGC